MKLCPWCNTEYPEEFFEEHHINHIHEDDSEENRITICVKCHKRHHRESGYDTIIVKKTLIEEMISIERGVFIQEYRGYAEKKMKCQLEKLYGSERERCTKILEWIEKNGVFTLDIYDRGFCFTKEENGVLK